MDQNYERLPRFYKILLALQLSRGRFTLEYLRFYFKNIDMSIEK